MVNKPGRRAVRHSSWLLVLTLTLILPACRGFQHDGAWRLEWDYEVLEEHLDGSVLGFMVHPIAESHETWWVDGNCLVIERSELDADRMVDVDRRWFYPREQVIYSQNRTTGEVSRMPWRRWEEERFRMQREGMVRVVRGARPTVVNLAPFNGDQRLESHRNQRRRESWWAFRAMPGRYWRLRGDPSYPDVWRSPLLALGFDGVTPEMVPAMQATLERTAPAQIEDVTLPEESNSTMARVVRSRLRATTALSSSTDVPAVPATDRAALDAGTRRWGFTALWDYIQRPEMRTEEMDLWAVRLLLEEQVTPEHLTTLRERIRTANDEEIEELFFLVFAADPAAFDAWLDVSIHGRIVLHVLPMISVLSFRRPSGLVATIDRVLAEPAFFSALEPGLAEESRTWLLGVRAWLVWRERLLKVGKTAAATHVATSASHDARVERK